MTAARPSCILVAARGCSSCRATLTPAAAAALARGSALRAPGDVGGHAHACPGSRVGGPTAALASSSAPRVQGASQDLGFLYVASADVPVRLDSDPSSLTRHLHGGLCIPPHPPPLTAATVPDGAPGARRPRALVGRDPGSSFVHSCPATARALAPTVLVAAPQGHATGRPGGGEHRLPCCELWRLDAHAVASPGGDAVEVAASRGGTHPQHP